MSLVDCGKFNIWPTTKKSLQRGALKNTLDKSILKKKKCNSKKCPSNPPGGRRKKSEEWKMGSKQKINNTMSDLSLNISIITLHVSSLNSPIKRQKFAE